jgi:hypothetical protein
MPLLTEQELERIEERAEKATPGPWRIAGFAGQHDEEGARIVAADGQTVAYTWGGLREASPRSEWSRYHADAAFIPHARTDIPALIASHREQGALIKELAEALADADTMLLLLPTRDKYEEQARKETKAKIYAALSRVPR